MLAWFGHRGGVWFGALHKNNNLDVDRGNGKSQLESKT